MIKKYKLYLGLGILIAFVGIGCEDAKYTTIDNGIYIAEASNSNLQRITVDNTGGAATVTVRSASFYSENVNVKIGIADAATLAAFNSRNGTAYVPLPSDNYSLSASDLVIEQGAVSAPTVTVTIESLTEEQINSGDKYVLPITIVSADENLMESTKSMFYVIDQVIISPAPYVRVDNRILIELGLGEGATTEPTLAWTLEYRTWVETLWSTYPRAQSVMWMGDASTEIYLRWGDANVNGDLIMMKTQGAQFISTKPASSGRWYHHAWVHDGTTVKLYVNGEFDTQMDSPGLMSRIGTSFGMDFSRSPKMYSELRFWSVARTEKEVKENMFSVNPQSEGLEFYFKFNEGTGDTFKDSAKKYPNAVATTQDPIEWRMTRSDEQ